LPASINDNLFSIGYHRQSIYLGQQKIDAKITYISKKAEYTPPIIYSKESRDKMVFLVEAKADQNVDFLHTGLPVDVSLDQPK